MSKICESGHRISPRLAHAPRGSYHGSSGEMIIWSRNTVQASGDGVSILEDAVIVQTSMDPHKAKYGHHGLTLNFLSPTSNAQYDSFGMELFPISFKWSIEQPEGKRYRVLTAFMHGLLAPVELLKRTNS